MTRVPKYRHFKARNKGFVEVDGKRRYLAGKYNSPESLKAYADVIKELSLKQGFPEDTLSLKDGDVTINELCLQFLDWAKTYYIKHGRQTGMYKRFCQSVVPPLISFYGETVTSDFGPRALKKVRQYLINTNRMCRTEINCRIRYMKQIFSWGVENELVPEAVAGALHYVKPLRKEEQNVRESTPLTAVSNEVIDATILKLHEPVADMVRIHRAVGCRPSEVCNLRWADIDETSEEDIWIYTPWEFKTEHRKKRRNIPIPPEAQQVLEKYRRRPVDEFIFSPRETLKLSTKKKRKDAHRYHDRYRESSYGSAIRRACQRAGVPVWCPYQLRHTFATNTRKLVGIEVAQLLLGHAQISTTELYAEKTIEAIKAAARKLLSVKKKTE